MPSLSASMPSSRVRMSRGLVELIYSIPGGQNDVGARVRDTAWYPLTMGWKANYSAVRHAASAGHRWSRWNPRAFIAHARDFRQQVAFGQRLGEITGHAHRQIALAIAAHCISSECDHRNAGPVLAAVADVADGRRPVHHRHVHVEQDDVERFK